MRIYSAPLSKSKRQFQLLALVMFAVWLGTVLFLTWHHAVWRDEMRALSLALQGQNVFTMLAGIHGEGHPAVWYLLLRGAHALVAGPEVLQLVSISVACAAVLLFVLRAPFSWPLIALFIAGRVTIFEYSVVARNYGISMLLLFLFPAIYEQYWNRGFILGLILFLLANCNAPSVLFVGALLLFWLVDIVTTADGVQRPRALRTFLLNAAIAGFGIAICFLTIYPPFNDAAMINRPEGITFKLLLKTIFLPATQFRDLMLPGMQNFLMTKLFHGMQPYVGLLQLLLSLIMFGSTLGLIRQMGAFLAALLTLVGFSLFFVFVYPGGYRHEALWLVFLISMYWLTASTSIPREPALPARLKPLVRPLSKLGSMLFVLLVLVQVSASIREVANAVCNWPPMSRSRDLGALVAKRSDLQQAIIIAEPDYLVEALPYYISNRTYLIREQRFGNVVHFTRKGRLQLSLDDVLTSARSLRLQTGKPVLILLTVRLDPSLPRQVYTEVFGWEFITTPAEVRTFQASTRLIERFAPASTDESYDVYIID
jgi:hypothetical protein